MRRRYKTPNPNTRNDLQTLGDSPEHTGRNHFNPDSSTLNHTRKRGRPQIDYPSIQSPTIGDIREAASFYEGEGCCYDSRVIINQNDREKLDWLCVRFGGKVYGPYVGKPAGNDFYSWILARERELGFMFTIFT